MPDVSFRVEMAGDVPVVVTPGDIDITNAAALRTALLEAAGRSRTFVVDMSRTQFCDTAGLHALVAAHKRAEGRRRRSTPGRHQRDRVAHLRDHRL